MHPTCTEKNRARRESGRGLKGGTAASAVVAAAEHRGEGHHLVLAAAPFTRLLVVALGAGSLDDVLAIELLFHAAKRTIDGLVFANSDFDGHDTTDVV